MGITPAACPFPIALAKAITNLERDRKLLAEHIPRGSKRAFMARVKEAIRLYYSLHHPGTVSQELNSMARSLWRGDDDIEKAIDRLSPAARDVLEQLGPLPDFTDRVGKDAALEFLRQILITGEYWQQQKTQRRRIRKVIGTRNPGRPQDTPEMVLVSYLATAFACFTGHRTTRSWSEEENISPFERVVEGVFVALQTDDQHSVPNLVREHIRAREMGQ